MLGFGFGFVEVGTLTPQPQAGNPRPRLFRLAEDEAVINRHGLQQPTARRRPTTRLAARRRGGIVGVNIGANKDSADRVADYALGVRTMAPVADYLTVNVSSPNTPGLRGLQDSDALEALLAAVMEARGESGPPVFLKIAPDLDRSAIDDIAEVALAASIHGLIVSNTTVSRPRLHSRWREEAGGLSGAPLKALALERLRDVHRATGGKLPLIAAGGIASGADAYAADLRGREPGPALHGAGLSRARAGAAYLPRIESFARPRWLRPSLGCGGKFCVLTLAACVHAALCRAPCCSVCRLRPPSSP